MEVRIKKRQEPRVILRKKTSTSDLKQQALHSPGRVAIQVDLLSDEVAQQEDVRRLAMQQQAEQRHILSTRSKKVISIKSTKLNMPKVATKASHSKVKLKSVSINTKASKVTQKSNQAMIRARNRIVREESSKKWVLPLVIGIIVLTLLLFLIINSNSTSNSSPVYVSSSPVNTQHKKTSYQGSIKQYMDQHETPAMLKARKERMRRYKPTMSVNLKTGEVKDL